MECMALENVSNLLCVISELYSACLCFLNSMWRNTYMCLDYNFANINRSLFQSNNNSLLPLEMADDLFDEVSFPFMIN